MEKVLGFLKGIFYLATCEGEQPRVRPFDSAAEYDGRIYFGTANNKKVYEQLMKNPRIEIFAMGDEGSLRLTGEAFLEEDGERARAAFAEMGKYVDSPNLAAFFIVNARGQVLGRDGGDEVVEF